MVKQRSVTILPQNIVLTAAAGDNLYRLLAERGVLLDGDCGGRGTCRRCRVRLLGAAAPVSAVEQEAFSAEELREGWRLACLQVVDEPLCVEIPAAGDPDLTVAAQAADVEGQLALAVDVGTTSVAVGLVAVASGAVLATASRANSQRTHGADVITRLGFALERPDGTERLQELVWQDIALLLDELCAAVGADKSRLSVITLAANSTMAHFLWGVPPRTLARAPYEPAFTAAQTAALNALPVGRLFPGVAATVYLLPNIAGFLGSDTAAATYACRMQEQRDQAGYTLLLDIGTNGELVLAGGGQLLASSAAAGPAFEGAHLSCGMRGTAGALHTARLIEGELVCDTINNAPLAGICGSGLLSLAALLRREQVLDRRGRFCPAAQSPLAARIEGAGAKRRFRLSDAVWLTQEDVRQFQLAKGAIAACWQSLLATAHAEVAELEQVLLAGMFGSKLDLDDAMTLGLLPAVGQEKTHHVGNAAWQGAYLAALSAQNRQDLAALARAITYLNTAGSSQFSALFVQALLL